MKVKAEIEREYYKAIDTPNITLPLYYSNNQYLIDSSTQQYRVWDVTNWFNTQTYILNQPVAAKDLTLTAVVEAQARSGWSVTVTVDTDQGTFTILSRDFGFAVSTTVVPTLNLELPQSVTNIKSITINSNCYRNDNLNCYGRLTLSFAYTSRQMQSGTPSNYTSYVDKYKCSLPKINGTYYGIGG